MGSITYNFLTESLLFSEKYLRSDYRNISLKRLKDELREYRNFCVSNKEKLLAEVRENESTLKISPGIQNLTLKQIKQTAFYIDQYVIDDPLFKLTHEESELSKTAKEFIGFSESSINKKEVANVVRFLKEITPYVAANYIKLFPLSHTFEPPEKTPVYFPDDYYSNSLPEELLEWFSNKAIIRSISKTPSGWEIENSLYPSRSIFIRYENHDMKNGYFYHLHDTKPEIIDEESRKVRLEMTLPKTPPEKEYFEKWVTQSFISSALDVFNRLNMKLYLSSKFGCSYLTKSEFEYELLNQEFGVQQDIKSHTYGNLLNFELPFLANVDKNTLMKLRQNEAESFNLFRKYLDKRFSELRLIDDESKKATKIENLIQEIGEYEVQKLDTELSNIKSNFITSALIAAGEISIGLVSNKWLSAIGTAKGLTTYSKYQDLKNNPVYFLWKSINKSG